MTCRSRCPDTGTLVCLDLHSISWVMLQFSTVVIPLTGVHCELNFLALTKIQTAHGELAFAGKNQTRFKGWFVLLHNFTDLHGTGRIKRWIRFSLSIDANRPFSHTILFCSKAHVRQRISLRILCFYVCFKVIRGKVANGNIKFHYKPLAASSLIYTDPSLEAQSAHKSASNAGFQLLKNHAKFEIQLNFLKSLSLFPSAGNLPKLPYRICSNYPLLSGTKRVTCMV